MSFASLHASAVSLLSDWRPEDPAQESLRQSYLAYLDARPDAMERACAPGHLTASAVLVDAEGERTLLTLHPRIGRWVQLGGHCEADDATLVEAALREAREESGIDNLLIEQTPLHLDVHPLTCSGGVPTRHFDVRFLVRAPADVVEKISDESLDLRWFGFSALPGGLDRTTRALIALAGETTPHRAP